MGTVHRHVYGHTRIHMSKHETPMIRRFWEEVGGTLIEEFQAVPPTATCGRRRLDAVILPDEPRKRLKGKEVQAVSLKGKNVVVVQAKAKRLGMYLMGQAVFSASLIRQFNPLSIRSIALCKKDDSVLRPLLAAFPHVEVVIMEN